MKFESRNWQLSLVALALIGLWFAGCSTEGNTVEEEEAVSGELKADEASSVNGESAQSDSTVEEVDEWGGEEVPTLDDGVLDEEMITEFEEVEVPVLLPSDEHLLADAIVLAEEKFYTVTMHVEDEAGERDHVVIVQGTRLDREISDEGVGDDERGDDYHIERVHKIPTLKFERFGISYQVHVECNRPHKNHHCTEDDYIESIADSLAIVPGK